MNDSSHEKELNGDIAELSEDGDTLCDQLLNERDQGSVDMQKNNANEDEDVEKESSSGNEGNHVKLFPKSKPLAISEAEII